MTDPRSKSNPSQKSLAVLPVYNEANHVHDVLDEVKQYSEHVLVVDDGSTDGTAALLKDRHDVAVVTHHVNQGYGAALRTAFKYATEHGYWGLVTVDCDGQHEPQRIPRFLAALQGADIVSGSRYLKQYEGDSEPPGQRRWINQVITAELNEMLELALTDAFCGFKAYRVEALQCFDIREPGYAMPLELWVQAAHLGLKIIELPVPLIYLDEKRSFGGALDDGATRLTYYRSVIEQSREAVRREPGGRRSHFLCKNR